MKFHNCNKLGYLSRDCQNPPNKNHINEFTEDLSDEMNNGVEQEDNWLQSFHNQFEGKDLS